MNKEIMKKGILKRIKKLNKLDVIAVLF